MPQLRVSRFHGGFRSLELCCCTEPRSRCPLRADVTTNPTPGRQQWRCLPVETTQEAWICCSRGATAGAGAAIR